MGNNKYIIIFTIFISISSLFIIQYKSGYTISTAELTAYKIINRFILNDLNRCIETDHSFRIFIYLEMVNSNGLTHLINYYKETFSFTDAEAVLLAKYHALSNTIPYIPQVKWSEFLALGYDISADITCATSSSTEISTILSSSEEMVRHIPVSVETALARVQDTALRLGSGTIVQPNGPFPFTFSLDLYNLSDNIPTGMDDVPVGDIGVETSEDVLSEELPKFQHNSSISGKSIVENSGSSMISDITVSPSRKKR